MGKSKYDWRAADTGIRNALADLFAAQRHMNYGKRVNMLNDLVAAEAQIAMARRAVESPRDVAAVARGPRKG